MHFIVNISASSPNIKATLRDLNHTSEDYLWPRVDLHINHVLVPLKFEKWNPSLNLI